MHSSNTGINGDCTHLVGLVASRRTDRLPQWFTIPSAFIGGSHMCTLNVSLRWVGSLLLAVAGAVGCAQSGTGSPVSATASRSDGASISASPSNGIAQAGPGGSYDATGVWHYVVTDKPNGNLLDEGFLQFIQDADGNLKTDDGTGTLTRTGTGRTIHYSVSIIEHHRFCDTNLSGEAELFTMDNTMQVHVAGTDQGDQGCKEVKYWLVLTKGVI
jgi:hypothetical protein